MKKFFGFLMAAAVLFGASSCVKEDISSSLAGGEVEVTLTANLADLGTRAIGDGTSATNLYVAIYEAGTNNQLSTEIINPEQAIAVNGKTATVRVVLLKDKHYDLVFWAQSPNATCYTRDWAERNIKVSYEGAVAQDENRDAFFGVWNNWQAGHDDTTFELRRPFAQLNAGLSQEDVNNIENNKVSVADLHAAVTVKNVANILNLGSNNAGTIDGEVEATFASAAKPGEDLLVGSKAYNYLSMNYLLVNEKQNVDVTYTLEEVNEESEGTEYVRPYYNVPVQRNYRTNIIGNLISSPMEFTVIIVPEFYEPANNYVTTAADLQEAINSAKAGETLHIVLGDNIVGDVMAHIKPGVDIIINGENIDLGESNFKYDGTIKIHHGSNYNDGKITIKNINFETATPSLNFIMPNDFGVIDGVTCRYSQNVTVENCTFNATGEAVDTVVGVQAKACNNLKVIGCTATNMHSLIQAQSCGGDVVVKNSTVNGKNGVAFKQVKNAVVEGCTIVAKAYGIRFDGNTDNYGITANNNSVTAVQPLIVRKMTGKDNTITLSENEFNVVDAIYQIVITKGSDDEAYVYPTGTYTITGHEGCTTYPIADKESLTAAIANPLLPVVEVEGAVENVGLGFEVKRDAVLNFNNNVLNAGSDANSRWYAIEVFGNYDVAINDANFTRAGVYAEDGANVVFNNGVINHKPERSSRYIFCAQSGSTITVKDGTFSNDRPNNSYFWADNATIVVEGGNFGGSTSTKKVVLTNNGQLIIKGGTFNFDPTAWLAAGYSVVKVNGTWTVVKGENVTAATNIDSLVAAMNEGKSEIYLAAGTYTFPASEDIKAGVTITCAPGTVFTGNSKLNIKGATVIGAKFSNPTGTAVDQTINGTFKNCTFEGTNALRWCYAGETVVFEDCVFSGSTYGVHFDGGANYVVFRNCTLSGFNAFAAATTLVTFEGCTFVGNGKSNYNGANLWGSATMVNCEFTFNGSTGNEWIDCIGADKTYSFENCTINGVAYTAENYAEYLANIESRNEITVKINGVDCAM